MLQLMRNLSASWFMKAILGVLVISFGLFWGISDMFRSRNYDQIVAVVNGVDISKQALTQEVQNRLNTLKAELKGQTLSIKQFNQFIGIQRVLDQMINEMLLDAFSKEAGVTTPDSFVQTLILKEPAFKNAQGQFDPQRFKQLLESNGLQESVFLESIRKSKNRAQILEAMIAGGKTPAILSLKAYQYFTTQRLVSVIQNMPVNIKRDDQSIRDYFEKNIDYFKEPEKRKIFAVILNPEAMEKKYNFSPMQIKEAYAQNMHAYTQPEKRTATVVVSDSLEDAKIIQKKILKKESLVGYNVSNLKSVVQSELNKNLGDALFVAQKDKPVLLAGEKNRYIIFCVTEIELSQTLSLDKAEPQILKELKRQRALEEVSQLTEAIESLSNKGLTLEEIATQLKIIPVRAMLDSKGKVLEGHLNVTSDLLKDAFLLAEGQETPITTYDSQGSSYLLKVEKIIPRQAPNFESVKDKATKFWIDNYHKSTIRAAHENFVKQAKISGNLGNSSLVRTIGPMSPMDYNSQKASLPLSIMKQIFSLPVGEIALLQERDKYFIVHIQKVLPVPAEKNIGTYKAIRENMSRSLNQDLLEQFLQALRYRYKVQVHSDVVQSLVND